MLNKKSQSLSINTIIIAAIALIVLVVIIVIFTGGIGKTSQNLGSCVAKGGLCADDKKLNGACGGDYPLPLIVSIECPNTKPVKNLCCLKSA